MSRRAVIVGAGPAGLSASIGLSRLGFQVEVFEQRKDWAPRVCGAFLSPEAQRHLNWLRIGSEIREMGAPCPQVQVHALGQRKVFSIEQKGTTGHAVPRKTLEDILLRQALSEGVRVRFGQKLLEEPACDLFVAAGGKFSAFQNEGFGKNKPKEGWVAFHAEFNGAAQKPGELSLHFFPGAYAGTLSFSDGTTNLSGLVHSRFRQKHPGSWEETLAMMKEKDPGLGDLLKNAVRSSPFIGIPFLPFGSRLVQRQKHFFAGDNAMVCDPFMGEGIARSLGAGPALFLSLKNGLTGPRWKEEGLKNYIRICKESYAARAQLGGILRWNIKTSLGIFALTQGIAGIPLIRSWVLGRAHRPPAWTEAH